MFFGRQTRQEISLNTSFFTSYSETCLLQVGGWNRQLSISFKPCTGTDANGIRTYAEDKSQYIITSLTADKVKLEGEISVLHQNAYINQQIAASTATLAADISILQPSK